MRAIVLLRRFNILIAGQDASGRRVMRTIVSLVLGWPVRGACWPRSRIGSVRRVIIKAMFAYLRNARCAGCGKIYIFFRSTWLLPAGIICVCRSLLRMISGLCMRSACRERSFESGEERQQFYRSASSVRFS